MSSSILRQLPCVLGAAALLCAAPAASAQATPSPTKAQAFTVAGDVATAWVVALDAPTFEVEACGRRGVVRQCLVHVFRFLAVNEFDCHWSVRVRVLSGDRLAWRTMRKQSLDLDCPAPLPAGPPTTGEESVPATGRIGAGS
jgi:hypothetical protein